MNTLIQEAGAIAASLSKNPKLAKELKLFYASDNEFLTLLGIEIEQERDLEDIALFLKETDSFKSLIGTNHVQEILQDYSISDLLKLKKKGE